MGKNGPARHLNHLYPHPVPVEVYLLPEVYPHNPVSWLYFAYKLASYLCHSPTPSPVDVTADGSVFKVTSEPAMLRLWRSGFYGKGVLSRSEPTWRQRHQQQQEASTSTSTSSPALEAVTVARRQERQQFKQLRAQLQQLEIRHRKHELNEEEVKELEKLRVTVEDLRKGNTPTKGTSRETTKDPKETTETTRDNTNDNTNVAAGSVTRVVTDTSENAAIADLEYLQLSAVETLWLLHLGSIRVHSNLTASAISRQLGPAGRIEYAAYHYFRSLGWCVRDGLKFGAEFLLYKRGPVFGHAEFAIKVVSRHHQPQWTEMATVARVIGTVNKTLVVCYVTAPDTDEAEEIDDVAQWVSQYRVAPVMYRRWNPSRTRD
ncbi:hypothetical protein DIURU_005590 [Diutina rugosa]|uniref:tRNA-splicing endonuclease subunit Sen2 n=1 Tax=Diutina rugosa TaxID=5481 RepID=A0A642UCU2_DIURU|nr:uncharacterized protein DIURU_005590 [Diutina rugosa]KAA8896850.1 hypothetical protein DIURU_005590 [Diutina rugosa]